MPPFGPVKRVVLIRYLRSIGFQGPFPGTRHQVMTRGDTKIGLPNPHRGDVGVPLLRRLLQEAGISREEWERLS